MFRHESSAKTVSLCSMRELTLPWTRKLDPKALPTGLRSCNGGADPEAVDPFCPAPLLSRVAPILSLPIVCSRSKAARRSIFYTRHSATIGRPGARSSRSCVASRTSVHAHLHELRERSRLRTRGVTARGAENRLARRGNMEIKVGVNVVLRGAGTVTNGTVRHISHIRSAQLACFVSRCHLQTRTPYAVAANPPQQMPSQGA